MAVFYLVTGLAIAEHPLPTEVNTLEPGEYLILSLDEMMGGDRIDVFVKSTSELDVLLFDRGNFYEYERWLNGERVSFRFLVDGTFLETKELRRVIELRSSGDFVIVLDNTQGPSSAGAAGERTVVVENGVVQLSRVGELGGVDDWISTLLLRQDFAEVPFLTGIGIAGPSLIFAVVSFGAWGIAASRDEGVVWLGLLGMAAVSAAFTVFVQGVGVVIPDTRLLSIPGAALGYLMYRRTFETHVSVAAVFAFSFWGVLLGADAMNLLMNIDHVQHEFLYGGVYYVIGGAGWGDGLIIVPIASVVTFFLFKSFFKRTRLEVSANLQGTPEGGTLFVRVDNTGEQAATNVRVSVWAGGSGLPNEHLDRGPLAMQLAPKASAVYRVAKPFAKLPSGIVSPEHFLVGVEADNAELAALTLPIPRREHAPHESFGVVVESTGERSAGGLEGTGSPLREKTEGTK